MVPREPRVPVNADVVPSRNRLYNARLGLAALLAFTFTLAHAATPEAQVLSDPRVAEFDPSPDHWVVLASGAPAVLRYELEVYPLGASAPVVTVDMGKPSPGADGKIRYDFSAEVAAWPLPDGNYEARVSAIGPQGSALSDPSNPFTFSQNSMCGSSLNPTALSVSASGGNYEVDVTTGSGCDWAVADALSWVTVGTGGGSGSGTVPLAVQANLSSSSRTGTIEIAGQTITVWQDTAGSTCNYGVSPTYASMPAAGGEGEVSVVTSPDCAWTADSSANWLTPSSTHGTGGAALAFTVKPNNGMMGRSAKLTVGPWVVWVSQSGKSRRSK